MERTGYLRLIWASKLWLLMFAIAAAAAVFLLSSMQENEYESEALGQIISASQAEGEILSEEQLLSLSNLYSELAKTTSVLDVAHKERAVEGHAAEFDSAVSVRPETQVGVLGFVAKTADPDTAAAFANAYAEAFSRYLEDLQIERRKLSLRPVLQQIDRINEELEEIPSGDPRGAGLEIERQALQERIATEAANPGDTMRTIEPAIVQSTPVSPRPTRNALLAFIGALVLGAALVYLRDLLFDHYRSPDEAARDLGLSLLGEIPKGKGHAALESFRTLRTGMMLALEQAVRATSNGSGRKPDDGISLLITGAESGCGKSYISSNIARTLAAEGRRVAVVDADLRRPTLHENFSVPLSPGLSDILLRDEAPPVNDLTVRVRVETPGGGSADGELHVLPAGRHAETAVERLSSDRMRDVAAELRNGYEVIAFDSPPTTVVVDPVVLSRYADGVLFVIDSRRTRRRDARRAVETLRAIGAPILGFAFNRSQKRLGRYDYYRPREREVRRRAWQPKETKA